MIPLSVPCIKGNEWKYIKGCLDEGWVSTAGSYVNHFENQFIEYTGSNHAIACINGTAALHIALKVLDIGPNDEVLVPTLTFISTINAIGYVGAVPVFMDCDAYYNLDIEKTLEFIKTTCEFKNGETYNKITGRRIAAIMPVHVFGNAVYLEDLITECHNRGIKIIEDAAESLGTKYLDGRHSGTIGDIGCFSFNGNKIITTGGGGMIVTNNEALAKRALYLTTQAKDDEINFIHNEVGYNYRLTNIQAAMGVAQLEQLPAFIERKKANYNSYRDALTDIPGLKLGDVPSYANNNYWMYALRIFDGIYGLDRDSLHKKLDKKGIQTRPVWYPNHLQLPYRKCQTYKIERAITLYKQTINIPCSACLSDEELNTVIQALRS